MHSIEEQLVLHEGLRTHAYQDTKGLWTVGVGYNLSARGTGELKRLLGRPFPADLSKVVLTEAEALQVLAVIVAGFRDTTKRRWPHFDVLDAVRQKVVLDLVFNMGHRAETFRNTKAAVERADWPAAAAGLLQSKWASDVGPDRAGRLSVMLRTGLDYVV